jgi:hypothetical protein
MPTLLRELIPSWLNQTSDALGLYMYDYRVYQALSGEGLALLPFWHRSLIVFFHNFYQLG